MNKNFYITTTLPYVNAEAHIGFALEIIQADVIARHQSLLGKDVFFNTGTDEHGLKIYRKALEEKKEPQKYVDEYASKFDNLKKALNLNYNNFIRTTDEHHKKASKEFWKRCKKNGDIYKAKQKIKYCVGCEMEKTNTELVKDKCPTHPNKKIEIIKEENYFFRFSKYQTKLLKLYKESPDFVLPKHRLKEISNFVSKGLKDFSISRLKSKMPWGIEVPDDPDHVMYVWFDALINYISAIGWPENENKFKKWWPVIQLAGKDNLRQQSAIWQAMLMSAGLPPSKQILIHGFITSNGQKMSKSLGNVINPFELVKKYGTDAVRYYLLKEIPPFKDSDFTIKHFEEVYNADLANGLGNLVQRITKLCEINKISQKDFNFGFKGKFDDFWTKKTRFKQLLENYAFNQALAYLWEYISNLNKEIDDNKPWKKNSKEVIKLLNQWLSYLFEFTAALTPFLPKTAEKIIACFEQKNKIAAPKKPLFPRI